MASLGVRNNNPFNLRSNHVKWLGKTGSYKGFAVFDSIEYGLRAGLINLSTQVRRSSSLVNLVYTYAPPIENDSKAYYNYLFKYFGLDWQSIKYDRSTFILLAQHITTYEGCPIPISTLFSIDKQYHIFNKHLAILHKNEKV